MKNIPNFLLIAALILLMFIGIKVASAPAPYYLKDAGKLNKTVQFVCPGDRLTYFSDVVVNKVPLTVSRTETIFSEMEHRTVYPDSMKDIEIFNWDEKVTPKEFDGAKSTPKFVTLPLLDRQDKPFKPGKFRYIIALSAVNSYPIALGIPFEFKADCFK